jgi:hypothetical protein
MTPTAPEKLQDGPKSECSSPQHPEVGEICYNADNGIGMRCRSRHGVYREPLRVQTIYAEIRPTKISRIISMKIIVRSSFLLPAKARSSTPGFPVLKLEYFAQEPASSLSTES